MTPEGTTPEERIAAAARNFLEHMPPDLVEECHTLAALDPSQLGIRVHYEPAADVYAVVWVGRWLGSVAGAYVRGGTVTRDGTRE